MYLLSDAGKPKKGELRVQLLGSGTILREVIAAVDLLDKEFGIKADVVLPQLHRARARRRRCRTLEPPAPGSEVPARAVGDAAAAGPPGPAIAATDYVRTFANQCASSCRCATACSAPTATAAATPARICAGTSRSTVSTSPTPPSPPWPRTASSRQGRGPRDQGVRHRCGETESDWGLRTAGQEQNAAFGPLFVPRGLCAVRQCGQSLVRYTRSIRAGLSVLKVWPYLNRRDVRLAY